MRVLVHLPSPEEIAHVAAMGLEPADEREALASMTKCWIGPGRPDSTDTSDSEGER